MRRPARLRKQILPRAYNNVELILVLVFSILALGFVLLYRARIPEQASAKPVKRTNERSRR